MITNITDFHGHIETAAIIEAYLKELRAANPDFLFTSSGDNYGGSAYVSAIDHDNPTIKILNAMGLQVSAPGNHEFDKGWKDFRDRLAKESDFTFVSANVTIPDAKNIPPYKIFTMPNGLKVGFIGTVTTETPEITAGSATAGLTFTDPVAATNKYADQLKDGDESNGEADIVVSLFHENPEVAKTMNSNVDLVFAGHTHQATVTHTNAGALILQAQSFGKLLAKATVTMPCDGSGKPVVKGDNVDVSKVEGLKPDPTILGMYEAAKKKADELGAGVLGYIDAPANRGSDDAELKTGSNRGTESSLGNLIAESFKYFGEKKLGMKIDLAIMNSGGLRADLDPNKDGVVTVGENNTVQPFGNTFGTIEVTPAQIYKMLEQQWQPESSRKMLRLGLSSNVAYTYIADPATPDREKVDAVYIDGKLLDRDDTTTKLVLASNAFLLGGKDGYTVLAEGTNLKDTGIIDNEALAFMLSETTKDKPLHIDTTQRSIGYFVKDTRGAYTVIDLESLMMTGGEPVPATANIYWQDLKGNLTPVATPAIKKEFTPGHDGAGKAEFVWVPTEKQCVAGGRLVIDGGGVTRGPVPIGPHYFTESDTEKCHPIVLSLDKTEYAPGEKMTITIKAGKGFDPSEYQKTELALIAPDGVHKFSFQDLAKDLVITVDIPKDMAKGEYLVGVLPADYPDLHNQYITSVGYEIKVPELAKTGADTTTLTIMALSFMLAGAGALALRRRAL